MAHMVVSNHYIPIYAPTKVKQNNLAKVADYIEEYIFSECINATGNNSFCLDTKLVVVMAVVTEKYM